MRKPGTKNRRITLTCQGCDKAFQSGMSSAKWCSSSCRDRTKRFDGIVSVLVKHRHRGRWARTCEQCGNEFVAGQRTTRFCSKKCGNQARYVPKARPDKAEKPEPFSWRQPRRCKACGSDFTPSAVIQRFCSLSCQLESRKVEFSCKGCGQTVRREPRLVGYCSHGCKRSHNASLQRIAGQILILQGPRPTRPAKPKLIKGCTCCGRSFHAKQANSKYCSLRCRFMVEKGGGIRLFECEGCGKEGIKICAFEPRYCSKACSKRTQKRTRKDRQRATRTSKRIDKIPIGKLISRDGGRCYHCGDQVRLDVELTHPLAPTRDHFIPLARGGSHTWDNLVLAHRRCNCEKRDLMPEDASGNLLMLPV
jgi:hypothetical protein